MCFLYRAQLMLVVLCTAFMPPVPSLAQTTKLRIGVDPPANDFLPAFVAKEQGFFAKRGLDVTFVQQRRW